MRSSVYSSYGKGLRSARMDADVEKQESESCAGVGERLKRRGVAWTWNRGGRITTRQRVKLRELSSRQKMMRGRSFVRTWREKMRRAICLGWPSSW